MTNAHGSFIWYELLTSDPAPMGRFYSAVVGWEVRPFVHGADYEIFHGAEGDGIGGMAVPSTEANQRPGWTGYIGVDDVDATAVAIVGDGGAIITVPFDLPGVGRMAQLSDPQSATFYVMRGASAQDSTSFSPDRLGHCAWNELQTSDLPAALDFYTRHFGWVKGDAMDMGEMGDYRFIHHGEPMIGAMMAAPSGSPPPAWTFYFRVDDVDAAAARATEHGGAVLFGPMDVPGGQRAVNLADPQGALFGLVGPAG